VTTTAVRKRVAPVNTRTAVIAAASYSAARRKGWTAPAAARLASETAEEGLTVEELRPAAQLGHRRALDQMRPLLDRSTTLMAREGVCGVESLRLRGSHFFAVETRRRQVMQLSRDLGRIWSGDPYMAAFAHGLRIEFAARPVVAQRAGAMPTEAVLGAALFADGLMVIAEDLTPSKEREVVAHELAHLLLPLACDASESGEQAATSFADSF
jgi:hypothetical protein